MATPLRITMTLFGENGYDIAEVEVGMETIALIYSPQRQRKTV